MLAVQDFYELLLKNGIDFFSGVPDSLLKDFCAYLSDNAPKNSHIITANEGNAIALAAGHYLASGKVGLVYMQNSGLGNAINPIVSLIDKELYGVPVLLLIGWRGEPGKRDEPQHKKQGEITLGMLETLGIPFDIVPGNSRDVEKCLKKAVRNMKASSSPYALVVGKGTFESYKAEQGPLEVYPLLREEVIEILLKNLEEKDIVVSTTGKTSRELFECRERLGQGHEKDFLSIGSMGHASQIALGIAMERKDHRVFCLDGDGAAIMHLGGLAIIGSKKPSNLIHILINNGAHESVGGQPTAGLEIDFTSIAQACGYKTVFSTEDLSELVEWLGKLKNIEGPCFLEVRVKRGSRKDLGRPTISPLENKNSFMKNFLGERMSCE